MSRDWMPVVAGVCELVAAVCTLIGAGVLLFAAALVRTVPDIQNDPEVPLELITAVLSGIAICVLLLGVVSLAGGICGTLRRGWGCTLAGAVAALFTLPPVGILALVLTLVGEREFRGRAA